jgi:4,5-dihydroxyphthalate decarboxylase
MIPPLKTVTRTQGNNLAFKEGRVDGGGFAYDFVEVPVLIDAFRRMVRSLEFDVCEMALTTYVCARAHGKRFTALPVFLVRAFHHGAILVNTEAGIRSPKDLEGRRVGVNRGYTVTTGLWARQVLQQQYGVDLKKITWVLSGDEHVAEYRPPANVVPIEAGRKMSEMLVAGELAAAIGVDVAAANLRPLLGDAARAEQAGFDALRSRGHYPINHLVVVKDELLEAHPTLAASVFNAFADSKALYVQQLREGRVARPGAMDEMHRRVMAITGADPLPYGIEPNRRMLETAVAAAVEQGIIDRAPSLESLFPASTHRLVA